MLYTKGMSGGDKIAYFGLTDYRNKKTKFGIKNEDRSRHVYIIGKTGMGKSTLLENLAAQDILNGEGMCFVDPHGSAIDTLLEYVPEHRVTDVVYFAPFDTQFPISFNVLEDVEPDQRHLVVAGLIASFKKIWPDSFSARMEYILANILLALLEYPGATLLGVNRMLADKDYRDEVIKHVTDSSVKSFWIDEYNKWDPRYAREAGAAIQNKIGQFTANPLIRNIVGQEKTSFDLREMMDTKKIFLVNLSKGRIGESNANLLGGMLITKLYLAAMSRADVGARGLKELPPFFFFVDEFQNFANESFADILAEARKYKLNLTVAHQYVDQMQEEVASAIFGNVGTMITFRIGATDAEVFEKQFAPTFTAEDIVNLGKYQIYLSLMIDGIGSRPFSAATLPPIETPGESMRDHIIANSRYFYAEERHIVEKNIEQWYEPIKKPEKRRIHNPKDIGSKAGGEKNKESISRTESVKTEHLVHDAQTEMKDVVSPKLNTLLSRLDTKKDESKIAGSLKKKSFPEKKVAPAILPASKKSLKKSEKETKPSEKTHSTQGEGKIERGTKLETKSSLLSVLEKALAEDVKTKTQLKATPTAVSKKEKKQTVSLSHKNTSSQKEAPKHTSKKDSKPKKSTEPSSHQKNKSSVKKEQETKKTQREVPEKILRKILE